MLPLVALPHAGHYNARAQRSPPWEDINQNATYRRLSEGRGVFVAGGSGKGDRYIFSCARSGRDPCQEKKIDLSPLPHQEKNRSVTRQPDSGSTAGTGGIDRGACRDVLGFGRCRVRVLRFARRPDSDYPERFSGGKAHVAASRSRSRCAAPGCLSWGTGKAGFDRAHVRCGLCAGAAACGWCIVRGLHRGTTGDVCRLPGTRQGPGRPQNRRQDRNYG